MRAFRRQRETRCGDCDGHRSGAGRAEHSSAHEARPAPVALRRPRVRLYRTGWYWRHPARNPNHTLPSCGKLLLCSLVAPSESTPSGLPDLWTHVEGLEPVQGNQARCEVGRCMWMHAYDRPLDLLWWPSLAGACRRCVGWSLWNLVCGEPPDRPGRYSPMRRIRPELETADPEGLHSRRQCLDAGSLGLALPHSRTPPADRDPGIGNREGWGIGLPEDLAILRPISDLSLPEAGLLREGPRR